MIAGIPVRSRERREVVGSWLPKEGARTTRWHNLMISIDEEARKSFEADWLSGRSLAIKNYLPQGSSETYLGTLEELVCIDLEFRWRQSRGGHAGHDETVSINEAEVPTRVEDYVREFPELNQAEILERLIEQEIHVRITSGFVVEPSEYRSRFPHVPIDESLFSQVQPAAGPGHQQVSSQTASFPKQFGSYVLTQQLGRGGMGAVYRARQPSAGREVAIKIADVSSFNSASRELVCRRFETEAHAAASLSHDHVVPIFDVGSVEGQPFYAMRLVEGGDLGAASKAEPLQPRRAAQYMLGIARGIEAAHRKRMLHRDIKPQNILVDGATDRAMITDFGLARFTQDDSGMTQTGQILGTPSFMPPEQIKDSRQIDRRADIYSLGGTLYQLLTGRPPFKAADVQETLRQVLSEDPIAPRQVNSAVDRDLDTICLKCLEKNPDDRYSTAGELADELERFLDGRPIKARPAGIGKKALKWCRRNRSLAAATGVAITAVLVALIVSTFGWILTSRAKTLSDRLSLISGATASDYYDQIAEEPLFKAPNFADFRSQLLKRALRYNQQLIDIIEEDSHLRIERAAALVTTGEIYLQLGLSIDDADSYLQQSISAIEKMPLDVQNSQRVLRLKSNAFNGLGQSARRRNELAQAGDYFRRATQVRQRWTRLFPEDNEALRKLANSLMNEGLLLAAEGKLADSEARQLEAQEIRRALREAGESSIRLRRNIAEAEFNLAMLELENDSNSVEIVPRLHRASTAFRKLANEVPTDSILWQRLITALLLEADLNSGLGGQDAYPESLALIREALDDLRALLALSTERSEYCAELVRLYQQGIESLLAMQYLAVSEDEINHLDGLLQKLYAAESSLTDSGQPNLDLEDRLVTIRLTAAKQHALLSMGLDGDDSKRILKNLRAAIELYEQHASVVSDDPMLSEDLRRLRSVSEYLKNENIE